MKSVLVIDTPKNCAECPLSCDIHGDCHSNLCRGREEYSVNPNSETKPEWCPLRTIPNKREDGFSLDVAIKNDCYDGTTEDKAYLNGLDKGYNSCIDEILSDISNDGWIPCDSGLMPMEHDSIFASYKGTRKWKDAMFEKVSDEVNVTVSDENGNSTTTHAHTVDGKWDCDLLKYNKSYKVIAWQPLPTSYKPNGD